MGKIMTLFALISVSVAASAWGAPGGARPPGDVLFPGRRASPDRLAFDLTECGQRSTALILAQAAAPSASPGGVLENWGSGPAGAGDARPPHLDPNATLLPVPPPANYVHIGGAGEEGTDLWVPDRECYAALVEALQRHASIGTADQTCAAIMQKALTIQKEHPARPVGPTPEPKESPPPPSGASSTAPSFLFLSAQSSLTGTPGPDASAARPQPMPSQGQEEFSSTDIPQGPEIKHDSGRDESGDEGEPHAGRSTPIPERLPPGEP
jgi:hypothetical protein